MIQRIRERTGEFFRGHEDIYMLSIALVIGLAAGYGNIAFRWLIAFIQEIFYGTSSEYMLMTLRDTPTWKIVVIPAVGGLIVGLMAMMFKSARGHGVPDVIKVIALNRVIDPSVAVIKTISSAVTLGTGGSAGREGPIVQIGAAIGSGIGKLFSFSSARMKTAIAAGAAGGLAATFNAPIGGAMFAAEVLLGQFGLKTFSPIIISSVIATVVSRAHLGNEITFEVPHYELVSLVELPLYLLLGLITAIVAVGFIRVFYAVEDGFDEMPIPIWVKPALGGLLMGLIALITPRIMGVGYTTIDEVLNGHTAGFMLLALVVLKLFATSLTLGSGGSGGLFVPSLFVGAMVGGFFGWGVNLLLPSMTATSGAYALVAMGAMLAATMRAPITSILIIFEITQNYAVILPLMLASIIANIAASAMEKESIFSWILTKQGIRVRGGAEEQVMESIRVDSVMLKEVLSFTETTPFKEIHSAIRTVSQNYFPVLDSGNYLIGMISLDDIKEVLFEEGLGDIVVAGEICTRDKLISVAPEDSLNTALSRLGIKDLGAIPVVEEKAGGLRLAGLLRRSDIIIAYNREVMNFPFADPAR